MSIIECLIHPKHFSQHVHYFLFSGANIKTCLEVQAHVPIFFLQEVLCKYFSLQ